GTRYGCWAPRRTWPATCARPAHRPTPPWSPWTADRPAPRSPRGRTPNAASTRNRVAAPCDGDRTALVTTYGARDGRSPGRPASRHRGGACRRAVPGGGGDRRAGGVRARLGPGRHPADPGPGGRRLQRPALGAAPAALVRPGTGGERRRGGRAPAARGPGGGRVLVAAAARGVRG